MTLVAELSTAEDGVHIAHRPRRRGLWARVVDLLPRLGHSQRRPPGLRRAQMEMLAGAHNRVDVTPAERRLNAELLFAAASLGVTVIGTLAFPPLRLLSLPCILYSLVPMYRDGYRALRAGNIGVDVIYVGTQTLVVARGFLLPASLGTLYYFLSRKLMVMAEERFRLQLHEIFGQLPSTVHKVVDGQEVACSLDEIQAGDRIAVRAGEIIPVDGVAVAGMASVDQQRLTGEAQPADKDEGDPVYAATLVLDGWLHVAVGEAGESTVVAQIGAILAQSREEAEAPQLWADWLGDRAVLPILALGGLSIPLVGLDSAQAIVDSHPQRRMNISSGLCTLNYLGLAAEQDLLVKDGRALELLQQVDTVVFDKTGTLTLDEPQVARIYPANGYSTDEVLRYAASAEARQAHPIARAILQAAADQGLSLWPLDEAQYHVGFGLAVQVASQPVQVGSVRFLTRSGVDISGELQAQVDAVWEAGHSAVLVAVDGQAAGLIELRATVRPEAAALIDVLHARGLRVVMISGDHGAPTALLAETLGIDHYEAEVLPEEKARMVAELQAQSQTVCFVGDGINDTIAMQQADVAVSLRGATTAATDTARIVLMRADLGQLPTLLALTQTYTRNLRVTAGALLAGTALGLSGAYFLGFGLWHVTTINMTVFPISLGAAMWPRLRALQADLPSAGGSRQLPETDYRDPAQNEVEP
jgi:Cu2+-exporting ATPase